MDRDEAYALCAKLSGRCGCRENETDPCGTIANMLLDEITAADELDRMERERIAAEDDAEWA